MKQKIAAAVTSLLVAYAIGLVSGFFAGSILQDDLHLTYPHQPDGFDLECSTDPDQDMICTAYCPDSPSRRFRGILEPK